jgi:hypothetical protein
MCQSAFLIHWKCGMTSTAAMEAGSASVERLLAAAAATMEKARYCWAMTVAEDGSVNARPMGPQKSPASEDPFGILFLTRRGSRKALEIGRTGRLSVVYQHDADDSYVTLIREPSAASLVPTRDMPLAKVVSLGPGAKAALDHAPLWRRASRTAPA